MKHKFNKANSGFTLIELLVVISIITVISAVSIVNFRLGEKQKRVVLAADVVTNAFRNAQNFALSGKKTTNASGTCRTPTQYYVHFDYNTVLTLNAVNNCSSADLIESYTLPPGTRMKPVTGFRINGSTVADTYLNLVFAPPFGVMTVNGNSTASTSFTTLEITVQSSDGAISKNLTVDGVSGRIGE